MTAAIDLDALIKSSEKGFRVDVVGLAGKLNLRVYSVDLPKEESGHISEDDGCPYIEVNRNHPVTTQRFTVAHEISHYLKHSSLLKQKGRLDKQTEFSSPQEAQMEAEADAVAARILMPEDLVHDYFGQQHWTKLTRFNAEMIARIADEFRVSRALAVTRLTGLGFPIPFRLFA